MKKLILLVCLLFLCTSCFFIKTGYWANGKCRPKNPNFKLLKIPFKETDKLNFNNVYISGTSSLGFSFYSDGRLICLNSDDGFALKEKDVIGKNWNNAIAIGYWRFEENKIKIEYFVCQDSGFYNMKQGEFKGDTIFFERGCGSNPFKREICWDKYILSDFSFEK
jgi:hypothetical protein